MRMIDADRLCEDLLERWSTADKNAEHEIRQLMADVVTPIVVSQPTIEPKRGEWVAVDSYSAFGGDESAWIAHGNPTAFHYCSNCKEQAYADEFGKEILSDFCPNCGADLRKEKGDSEDGSM